MNEILPEEIQLFHAYQLVLQVVMNCLAVTVAVLLVGAIVLIVLCCRDLKLATRRRDTELDEAYRASLKNLNRENGQLQNKAPKEIAVEHLGDLDSPTNSRLIRDSADNLTFKIGLEPLKCSRKLKS